MSMMSEASDLAEILCSRNLLPPQGYNCDSILNQANRKFLENQKQSPTSPGIKRLVLGSQMFCVSQDGELVLDETDKNNHVDQIDCTKEENNFPGIRLGEIPKKLSVSNDELSSDCTISASFASCRQQSLSVIGRQKRFSSSDNVASADEFSEYLPVVTELTVPNQDEKCTTLGKNPVNASQSTKSYRISFQELSINEGDRNEECLRDIVLNSTPVNSEAVLIPKRIKDTPVFEEESNSSIHQSQNTEIVCPLDSMHSAFDSLNVENVSSTTDQKLLEMKTSIVGESYELEEVRLTGHG